MQVHAEIRWAVNSKQMYGQQLTYLSSSFTLVYMYVLSFWQVTSINEYKYEWGWLYTPGLPGGVPRPRWGIGSDAVDFGSGMRGGFGGADDARDHLARRQPVVADPALGPAAQSRLGCGQQVIRRPVGSRAAGEARRSLDGVGWSPCRLASNRCSGITGSCQRRPYTKMTSIFD